MKFSVSRAKTFFFRHYQYILVGILFLLLIIVLLIFSGKGKGDGGSDLVTPAAMEGSNVSVPLSSEPPSELTTVISRFFEALGSGDIAAATEIDRDLQENEKIKIVKKSEYVDRYTVKNCYTKPGPEDGSYFVFVYYSVLFKNMKSEVPGLNAYYVTKTADGSYAIKDSGVMTEGETEYMNRVAAEDDVLALLEKVDSEYSAVTKSDAELELFMKSLTDIIEGAVKNQVLTQTGEEVSDAQDSTPAAVEAKVRETVNVRKSASTEADKLGKVMGGDVVTVLESMDNGWSRIDFQGQEAYVKTEYLEIPNGAAVQESEQQQDVAAGEDAVQDAAGVNADTSAENTQNTSSEGAASTGKVKAKESVRIRKGASTDSEKVGDAYKGDEFELIMDQADGWCKIKYKGDVAYIKTEFVEVIK